MPLAATPETKRLMQMSLVYDGGVHTGSDSELCRVR
jgi:hypothetical protein